MGQSALHELKYSYDDENDILYLHIGDPQESVSEVREDGIAVKRHPQTGKVVGFIVFDFLKRTKTSPPLINTHIGIKGEFQPA